MAGMPCPICRDSKEPGWLCADHPGRPWGHDGCEAEGAPCACNPEAAVEWRAVFEDNTAAPERPH